jgi:cytochrome b subunit of formate dehydrogenase
VSLPESSSDEPRGVLVRRQKTTIYTVLLLIAIVALAISCLVMVLEWAQYGFQWKPPANLRSATSAVSFDAKV